MTDHSTGSYDYIVVGGGAAGSVVAGELSKTGADVLLVESGGIDSAPTIGNPSIWFYNVGGALDWNVPIAPVPQLNNRKFNMALGRVLGGGSSINAMVWSRGMDRDYDGWERNGAAGWGFKDVLPVFKSQEDWEGGSNEWRGAGGPIHVRRPGTPHPTAPAFLEAARQMGFALLDDVNGPLRAGAGYINMNIAADGSRVSAARAFLQPNLSRPNLTLLLDTNATKVVFEGDRAVGVQLASGDSVRNVRAAREVILAAGTIHTAQLLMLSGIGNAEELRKLGIAPVANLRGVGQNLQDHVLVSGVVYKYKARCPTARRTATPWKRRFSCPAASPTIPPISVSCSSSYRSRRRRRLRASGLRRKKALRSRRRSFSRPVADAYAWRAPIGAMLPSSRATIWEQTMT
jgi:choline dehydrogenase